MSYSPMEDANVFRRFRVFPIHFINRNLFSLRLIKCLLIIFAVCARSESSFFYNIINICIVTIKNDHFFLLEPYLIIFFYWWNWINGKRMIHTFCDIWRKLCAFFHHGIFSLLSIRYGFLPKITTSLCMILVTTSRKCLRRSELIRKSPLFGENAPLRQRLFKAVIDSSYVITTMFIHAYYAWIYYIIPMIFKKCT